MLEKEELTYWEYWLTKPVWGIGEAIQLVADYARFRRGWKPSETFWRVNEAIHQEVEAKIIADKAKHIFKKVNLSKAGYDHEAGLWEDEQIVPEQSEVDPKKFLEWLHEKGYALPYEFRSFIGLEEEPVQRTDKQLNEIDREVCQGIAKTLWDIDDGITIEEMLEHKAIRIYGSGALYSRDTTLRRWLSAVDPRKVKPGRKKKV